MDMFAANSATKQYAGGKMLDINPDGINAFARAVNCVG